MKSLTFRLAIAVAGIVLVAQQAFAQGTGWLTRRDSGAAAIATTINHGGGGNFGADAAFPGGGGDNFNFLGYGYMLVPTAGNYTFSVNQDDDIYVTVSSNGAPASITDTSCCNTDIHTRSLQAGVNFTNFIFREIGGGENVELSSAPGSAVAFASPPHFLVNSATNPLKVYNTPFEAAAAGGASLGAMSFNTGAQGFNVVRQNDAGLVGGTIDDINEGETVLAGGGAAEATATSNIVNYNRSVASTTATQGFPGGGGDNFALRASGFIDVLDPDNTEQVFFYVSSDDGFRLRVNGSTVSEFVGATGDSNTMSGLTSIKDGDFLDLTFFEAGGGEALTLARDLDGSLATTFDRILIGDPASGVLIFQTNQFTTLPEPGSIIVWSLIGSFGLGLGWWRMRRQK